MTRQRKGEIGCEEANQKWRRTMLERYGGEDGVRKKMQEIGRIGGINGRGPNYKGGFAADHERARAAGAVGGSISKRVSKYQSIFDENKKNIKAVIKSNSMTRKELSEALGVPYASLLHFIKKNM